MKKTKSIFDIKKPGEVLEKKEQKEVVKLLQEVYNTALSRRRYQKLPLPHYKLQTVIHNFFAMDGYDTKYEVPFSFGGFNAQKVIFDVTAEKRKKLFLIEVKDKISTRDLGQIQGYAHTIRITKTKAQLFLCTDIINYDKLLEGTNGVMIKDLMERESVGVILADKDTAVVCQTYNQLTLIELPEFWFSEEQLIG